MLKIWTKNDKNVSFKHGQIRFDYGKTPVTHELETASEKTV